MTEFADQHFNKNSVSRNLRNIWKIFTYFREHLDQSATYINTIEKTIFSEFLHRTVSISIMLPPDYGPFGNYPLLLVNDGQDFKALGMARVLYDLQNTKRIDKIVVIGIHANEDRLQEYGTAIREDYAKRGSKAGGTTNFVLKELLPFLGKHFHIKNTEVTYAGFSLGGLMAMDIAWNYPEVFSKTAVFSGALWWRQIAIEDGYSNADRIMHAQIRNTARKPALKFWFQTGTFDETDDRDGDGVIDSIQDTLECISELEKKGYRWGKDICYREVESGEHHPRTWSLVLPEFLLWAFGRNSENI